MDLEKIISITGEPGLYKLISQTKGGFIVEDLEKKKKKIISSHSQVSLLQNISIFTQGEESEPLNKVFKNIAEKYECKDIKFNKSDIEALRNMLLEVLPDYNKERVYDSEIRKLFQWYNILVKNNNINKDNYKIIENDTSNNPQEKEIENSSKADI